MAPSAKSPYHHGNLREALVAGARAILEKDGLNALSLRGVAREVGVSQAAPYHHFKDKDALLDAVAAAGFQDFTEGQAQASKAADLPTRAMDLGLAYVSFATTNPALFQLMFGREIMAASGSNELQEASGKSFGYISDVCSKITKMRGTSDQGDNLAMAAWSLVHGLSTLLVNQRISEATSGDPEFDAMVRGALVHLFPEFSMQDHAEL